MIKANPNDLLAIDFDGTLCSQAPKPPVKWGKMNGQQRSNWKDNLIYFYDNAAPVLDPQTLGFNRWHVISARKENPVIRGVSEMWLHRYCGEKWLSLHLLKESRSIENVVKFKSEKLFNLKATVFIEDNINVVKGLRKNPLCNNIRVVYFEPKTMQLFD